jgi:phosphonate transport system permease protein
LWGGCFWGDFDASDAAPPRRLQNLARFAAEVRPYPLQNREWSWTIASEWALEQMSSRGLEAATLTLAISIAAIVLAGIFGALVALPAARNFTRREVFLPEGRGASRWALALLAPLRTALRSALILLRAIPEYVWAFLLLGLLGPTPWVAVLALAIHNIGILGRLGAETVENIEPQQAIALRAAGASRLQIAGFALAPALLPRFLLYFFYRWETCVREATVLGMLGIASLGYWVEDARTRGQYDTFVFLIALGVALVLVGDLLSAIARRAIRRAS